MDSIQTECHSKSNENSVDKCDNDSEIPPWLNKEYFEKYLQCEVKNFEKITWFSVKPASKKGENYTSNLYRLNMEIIVTDEPSEIRSYILKVPLPNADSDPFTLMLHLYDKEMAMYNEILPRFEKLYNEQDVQINFAPKFYKLPAALDENVEVASVILLEDLSSRDFSIEDRLEGLNLIYTENALKKLAEFHAASARYVEVYGPYPDIFNEHMFSEQTRPLYESVNIDYFYEYLKEYRGHEEYIDKIPKLLENYVDFSIATSATDPTDFNVLNHGDFWVNNIMFRQDNEKKHLESYLIDFQLCKYGSPTLDLYMFLLSCPQLDIKIAHFDYFIKFYHDHLVKNLKILKYEGNIPTLKEMQVSLLKYGFTGFGTVFNCLSICLLEPNIAAHATLDCLMDDSPESEPMRRAMFLSERFKAHAELIMRWLANRGLLE